MGTANASIQQHDIVRAPSSLGAEGRRMVTQINDVFTDIYRRFGRLRIEDMGDTLKTRIITTETLALAVTEERLWVAADLTDLAAQMAEADVTLEEDARWLDTTTHLIKYYDGSDWIPVQANELHTSYIDISVDAIAIGTGGSLHILTGGSIDIDAGGDLNVAADGAVNISTNEFNINSADGTPLMSVSETADGGGTLVLGSDTSMIAFGGNFILNVENGGTGDSVSRMHRGNTIPVNSFGQDGDMYVYYSGTTAANFNDDKMTINATSSVVMANKFDNYAAWNYTEHPGYIKIGCDASGRRYGVYWTFNAPATVDSLTFQFVTERMMSDGEGKVNYAVLCVAGDGSSETVIASGICMADQYTREQTVVLSPSSGFTSGAQYSVGVVRQTITVNTLGNVLEGEGTGASVMMLGQSAETAKYGFYIKSSGTWYAI